MLYESFENQGEKACKDRTKGLTLILLSVATAIDALAVGSAYAFVEKPVIETAIMTGVITASLSAIGVTGGQRIGQKPGRAMEAVGGGTVLIAIGTKILLEHLF